MIKKNMYICALALVVPMCAVAGDKLAETNNPTTAHARISSSSIISGKNPNSFFYGRDRSGSKGSSSSDEEEKHSNSGSPVKADATRTRTGSHVPPLNLKKSSRTPSPARFGQPMSAEFETAEGQALKLSPRSQLALIQALISNLKLQSVDPEQVDILKEKVAQLDPFAASAATGKSSPTKDKDLPPLHKLIHKDKNSTASAQTSITISRRPEAVAKPGYVNYKAGQNPLKEAATGVGSDSSSSDSRRSSPKSDGAGSDADSSSEGEKDNKK